MSLLFRILLVCYAPMQFGLAISEEPTTEGLTSTFLMDLTMIPHLDSLDSVEHGHLEAREPGILTTLLQAAQGSGFSSQENDESTILQSPQYFLEDGADGNDTSLDLGPPTDNTFPVSPGKSIPRGNESEPRDRWETATPQLSKDLADPVTHTTYTHAVAEEDAVLLMEQNHHTQANEMDLGDLHSPGSMEREDLLESTVSSSDPGTVGESVGEKDSREEEAVIKHTLNEMSELRPNPSLAPLSVSPPATYAGFVDIPARPPEKSTRLIVGRKHADGKGHDENVNHLYVPTDPHSFSDENSAAIMPSEKEEHHTTAQHPRKVYRTTPPVPVKLVHASDVPLVESTPKPTKPNEELWNSAQVICKDWSNLAGKNYIILNMSDDINCELFRLQKGQQLLSMVEDALSRKNDRLQESWVISLSKPNEHEKHLLMTLVGEDGVVPIKDVLMAMGDIRRNLAEIGIQNYSTTTSCHSRPSQSRSDYGKLFVVLVIIGSICVMIIVSGLIYICWQRRLPKLKNMSRGEELHFVENGCHDNPTLDVTMDSQSEMQEKKPSLNGGALDGPDTWNILINKNAKEEPDVAEEDTHL